jgi:hypothetical protein
MPNQTPILTPLKIHQTHLLLGQREAVLVSMTATETAAHLEAIAERLRAQRRTQERLRGSDAIVPKYDW